MKLDWNDRDGRQLFFQSQMARARVKAKGKKGGEWGLGCDRPAHDCRFVSARARHSSLEDEGSET